jgi:hypothetical protein
MSVLRVAAKDHLASVPTEFRYTPLISPLFFLLVWQELAVILWKVIIWWGKS